MTDQPPAARPRSCPTCRSVGAPRPILSGAPGQVCQDQWHADPFAHLPLPERIAARASDLAEASETLTRELPQSMLMGTLPDGPDRSGRLLDFEPVEPAPCLFTDEHVRWRTTVFGGEVLAGQRATAQGIIGTLVDCSTCGPGHLLLDPDDLQPGDLVEDEDGAPLPDEQQPWGTGRIHSPVWTRPAPGPDAPGLTVDQQVRAAALTAAATFLAPTEEADTGQVIDLAATWVPWLRDGVLPVTGDETGSPA